MPQAKYRIKRVRLWDGKEYDLGTEIWFKESNSGVTFFLPYAADSDEPLNYCLSRSGLLDAHMTAEGLLGRRDLFDVDLTNALDRLGAGDFLDEFRNRILRARRFIADPSNLKSVGISWLLPIPTAAGAFDSSLCGEVLDASFLQPVSVEAPWQGPPGSVWTSFSAEYPSAVVWSVPFDQDVAVFLIPWFKCQKIIRRFIRQFVGPDGLLPSGEEFI